MTLTTEQIDQLHLTIQIIATISAICSLWVTLTYALFPIKTRTSTSQLIFALAASACLEDMVVAMAGYGSASLETNKGFCSFQSTLMMFTGNMILVLWFSVMINLFVRLYTDYDEIPSKWYILVAFGYSALTSVLMLAFDRIEYNDVWCFVPSSDVLFLVLCFYGMLMLLSVLGAFLWAFVVTRLVKSLRLQMVRHQKKFSSFRNRVDAASRSDTETTPLTGGQQSNPSTDKPTINSDGSYGNTQPMVSSMMTALESERADLDAKRWLILRQTVFVTLFLILYWSMAANRVIIWIRDDETFGGWMLHVVALSSVGFYVFLVFGLTQQNLQLWYDWYLGLRLAS